MVGIQIVRVYTEIVQVIQKLLWQYCGCGDTYRHGNWHGWYVKTGAIWLLTKKRTFFCLKHKLS